MVLVRRSDGERFLAEVAAGGGRDIELIYLWSSSDEDEEDPGGSGDEAGPPSSRSSAFSIFDVKDDDSDLPAGGRNGLSY